MTRVKNTREPRDRETENDSFLAFSFFLYSSAPLLPLPFASPPSASQRGSLDPRASFRNGVYIPNRGRISIRASEIDSL